jgi:hypothetical protein
MKRPLSSRRAANVSDSLRQRLHVYAVAASAAGVTMFALAPPGEAEIIYKRTHVHIGFDSSYSLDVNGDGMLDFTIGLGRGTSSGAFALPAQTGNEVVLSAGNYFAAALTTGAVIGSGANFGPPTFFNQWWMFEWYFPSAHFGTCWGPWAVQRNGYLGMKFMISGEVHYGWARFGAICGLHHKYVNLVGYAYESIPNQSIVAGKKKGALEDESLNNEPEQRTESVSTPGSLGVLALGKTCFR